MKKYILLSALGFFLILAGLYSCKRDYTLKAAYQPLNGTAFIHVMDVSPNFRNIFGRPDSFNVLVNNNKVSGYAPGGAISLTYNSMFPATNSNFGYVAVPYGLREIELGLGYLNPDSVTIFKTTKFLQQNQYYSLFITDSLTSPNDASQIFVQDVFTQPNPGYYNLRFVHAVWNDTTGKNVDVWSSRSNRNIFSNVKPGTVTAFSQFASNPQLNDTLIVRRTGNPGIVLATLNNVSFTNQRTYTLVYKGDANLTTGTKARGLTTYVNQ